MESTSLRCDAAIAMGQDQTARQGAQPLDIDQAGTQLQEFVDAHRPLRLVESGQRLLTISDNADSGITISSDYGKLVAHFWSPERSLVRRVVQLELCGKRLRLDCLRFGQKQPTSVYLEPCSAAGAAPDGSARQQFKEAVLAAVQREWPLWKIASTEQIASAHPIQRILLRKGFEHVPCLAVSENEAPETVERCLAEALAWSRDIPRRIDRATVPRVNLILPRGRRALVLGRVACLQFPHRVEVFEFDRSASHLDPVDLADRGNIKSELRRALDAGRPLGPGAEALLQHIREHCPDAIAVRAPDGRVSFRLYGLEFAREPSPAEAVLAPFLFGIPPTVPLTGSAQKQFERLLLDLRQQRHARSDRRNPLFALQPERWMEELLRADVTQLDAHCDPRFVYSQVPACTPGARDIVDLLAVRRDGRLCVFELKASEDLNFPLQALDYWLRVRHHQQSGDFERLGYFPGVRISAEPPILVLVAPALRWHPRADDVLSWIGTDIPLVRVEINEDWRKGILVLERREQPQSGASRAASV